MRLCGPPGTVWGSWWRDLVGEVPAVQHEELSLDLLHPYKKLGAETSFYNVIAGNNLWSSLVSHSSWIMELQISGRPLPPSPNKMGKIFDTDFWCLNVYLAGRSWLGQFFHPLITSVHLELVFLWSLSVFESMFFCRELLGYLITSIWVAEFHNKYLCKDGNYTLSPASPMTRIVLIQMNQSYSSPQLTPTFLWWLLTACFSS